MDLSVEQRRLKVKKLRHYKNAQRPAEKWQLLRYLRQTHLVWRHYFEHKMENWKNEMENTGIS